MSLRQALRTHRDPQTLVALVCRPQHLRRKPRTTGLGVQSGGLFVGQRADHRELVLGRELDRPGKEALRFAVLPTGPRPRTLDQRTRCGVVGRRTRCPLAMQRDCLPHRLPRRTVVWRELDPAQGADQVENLQTRLACHTVDMLEGLVGDPDRAGVVAAPEVQALFDGQGDVQSHAVSLAAGRRQHHALVVTALAGEQQGILAATHQIEAKLLEGLAKRARHRLGTDLGDQRLGERVDLGQRTADPK